MSKLLTLTRVKIERSTSGFASSVYTLFLSNNTKHEVLGSFTDTDEQIALQVATALLELNQVTYTHSLTKGHVSALAKFKRAVIAKRENSIHREHDLNGTDNELSKDESANLTFLRYHDLLIKDDNAPAGHWLITTRGNEFLRGERPIPKHVIVKNNEVIDHDGPDVTVTDVWADAPFWPRKDELVMSQPYREPVQAELFG